MTGKSLATPTATPVARLEVALAAPNIKRKFDEALADAAPSFIASITELYKQNADLQKCDPMEVVAVVLSAATLKLPINKALGFSWIIPYKKGGKPVPEFQIGYKGYIQLAIRTGLYRHLNAGIVYEGELVGSDKLTGCIDISGERKSDKVLGYFAHMETMNGFKKTVYTSTEGMEDHRNKYCKGSDHAKSAWSTDYDPMAVKTMIRMLLSKYGIMSIEQAGPMARALEYDDQTPEQRLAADIDSGDDDLIDVTPEDHDEEEPTRVCHDRNGDQMFESFCNDPEQCKKRQGCPSWSKDDGSGQDIGKDETVDQSESETVEMKF